MYVFLRYKIIDVMQHFPNLNKLLQGIYDKWFMILGVFCDFSVQAGADLCVTPPFKFVSP